MNWFQRYGIPGAYFVVLLGGFALAANWPECRDNWREVRKALPGLAAIGGLALLPVGYVLSITSQWLYYTRLCRRWHVHARAWRWAWDHRYKPLLGDRGQTDNEHEIEGVATLVARWTNRRLGPDAVGRGRFLREWFARRNDVMAINLAMILPTFLMSVLALLMIIYCEMFATQASCPLAIWVGVCLLVLASLVVSNSILSRQVVRLLGEYLRDLDVDRGLRDRLCRAQRATFDM